MADYWIKWYHEIIDDPKMATLPDRLWRRFSELCLLAGRLCPDKSGILPDTRQLAWMLRMNTDDLQIDLDQLSGTNMIRPIPNGWLIVNFQKRQQAASSTERVRQHRERKQKRQYYDSETDLKRNVSQSRLTETDSETEERETRSSSACPEIDLYHEVTGLYPTVIEEPKIIADIGSLRKKLNYPPIEKVRAVMMEKYSLWKSCRTTDGRPYNPSNPAWLEWCITGYRPEPGKPKLDPETERLEAARRSAWGG